MQSTRTIEEKDQDDDPPILKMENIMNVELTPRQEIELALR